MNSKKLIILTIIISSSNKIFAQNSTEILIKLLSSPKILQNEICLFNEVLSINDTHITCKCYDGFTKDNQIRWINNYQVDCSYFQRSRVITTGFSLILPFGADYFYLGHILIGIVTIILETAIFVLNCIFFRYLLIYDQPTINGNNADENFEKKYKKLKFIVCFIDLLFGILYIINIFFQNFRGYKRWIWI